MWIPELAAGPVYRALADAIALAIQRGELPPGARLPPQRELADALGVTMGTVSRGYQLACQRGLTQGEVGRGTFVRSDHNPIAGCVNPHTGAPLLDLSMNLGSPKHDPNLSALLSQIAREPSQALLHYQLPGGSELQCVAGVAWLARLGLSARADELLICGGAQHAIFLCLLQLLERGQPLLCEALTYPGAVAAARTLGLQVHPVPLDAEGVVPLALSRALRSTRAKVVYLQPTLHNPTTVTQGRKRREQVAEVLARHGAWFIEDDILGALLHKPHPPLSALLPDRGFFIGSLSKVVAGGLRVAYLRPPPDWLQRLSSTLQASAWMTSPLACELARRIVLGDELSPIIDQRRAAARKRSRRAQAVLGADVLQVNDTYHAWLQLDGTWAAESFCAEAAQRGVLLRAANTFHVGRNAVPKAARICLVGANSDLELEAGLQRLKLVLQAGVAGGVL